MGDESLQRLIADACLKKGGEDRLALDFDAFCKEYDVDPRDAEALRDTAARLAIYRRLVRNNVFDVCEKMMPRTAAKLGDAFTDDVARYLDAGGPRSRYLRDVPHEVFAHASAGWPADVRDLATLELAEFSVGAAPKRRDRGAPSDLALDKPVFFDDAVRALALDHAVHTDGAPKKTHLLLYRDAENVVRALELTPLAGALVKRLLEGEPLGLATQRACADVAIALDDEVLGSIARLLADFAERGALLGATADSA